MKDALFVSREELAKLFGISLRKVDALRKDGKLPSVKIGARRLFDVEQVRRALLQHFGETGAE